MHQQTATAEALLRVDVQIDLSESTEASDEHEEPPSPQQIILWAQYAYAACGTVPAEITVRVVDESEMTDLNYQFRGKNSPTNVLSFAVEAEGEFAVPDMDLPLLGDVVICHAVVVAEAKQQQKTLFQHYAHIVCHGVLHLCGYDHETDAQATVMEALEETILADQGIASPYQ